MSAMCTKNKGRGRGVLAAVVAAGAAVLLLTGSGAVASTDRGAGAPAPEPAAASAATVAMAARAAAAPAVSVVSVATTAPGIAPEADLSHHGYASLDAGRLDLVLVSRNHGPAPLAEATLRLELSARPVGDLRLPGRCLWAEERVVLCGTGPLRADGVGRKLAFGLAVEGGPEDEVVVSVSTQWNGGATDRNPANDEHRLLVPATGDAYAF
ncbi:hypothetical protein [Streptomyces sp. NPDC005805]|uniref:hypothetical protein n=1 Tax=Streptomyces sp. NPDC005805 TaxID=3157068 RepID=UPI0033C88A46